MEKFVIEDNVPVPTARGPRGYAELMRSLSIGQSVLITEDTRPKLSRMLHGYANHTKIKIVVRKQPDGFLRIWRTE